MIIELTVREVAERERVDIRTVYRWIDKGALEIRRTPGGGLRVQYVLPASSSCDNHRHLSQ